MASIYTEINTAIQDRLRKSFGGPRVSLSRALVLQILRANVDADWLVELSEQGASKELIDHTLTRIRAQAGHTRRPPSTTDFM